LRFVISSVSEAISIAEAIDSVLRLVSHIEFDIRRVAQCQFSFKGHRTCAGPGGHTLRPGQTHVSASGLLGVLLTSYASSTASVLLSHHLIYLVVGTAAFSSLHNQWLSEPLDTSFDEDPPGISIRARLEVDVALEELVLEITASRIDECCSKTVGECSEGAALPNQLQKRK
jgi:hypothetical protein